ncbi:hypothetical protein GGX14DRAFT_634682 [Mycena pura]|uniref:F-box domain-containing protein n=1 Tax=Mycena pura TaxID=153505 RepID=A0AAD6YG09_9AGAR|nr:hypothetical protein GGX14DRAFT_634682 [Mycena pura]
MISTAAALRAQLGDQSLAAPESQMTPGSLKYPVLTLPYEITVEIFLHFVSLMRQVLSRPQPYYGLLRLASVCQTWRAVTLSTCTLWNDIFIPTYDGDAGQLLKVCLLRAGSLPLDLHIWQLPEDVCSMDMLFSTLSLYGSQWRRIHLSSPAMRRIFLIDRFPSSLPLLECLTLSDLRVLHKSVSSPRHAPQLRELSVRNSLLAIQLGLPFDRLTKLDLSHFTITELLAVLPYTLNLESLQLAKATKHTPVVTPSILLPHLHTFGCRGDPSTMVLQYLTLPALERLVLVYLYDAGVHAILLCVARSCSTIRTLNINRLAFNLAYDCLCSLPAIRNLCLSCSWSLYDEDVFFAAMISGGCIPALESLTCKGYRPMRADKLFAVVSARWRGVEGTAKLNSVSLDFAKEDTEFANTFDQLYELGRQGLKLEITGVGVTR